MDNKTYIFGAVIGAVSTVIPNFILDQNDLDNCGRKASYEDALECALNEVSKQAAEDGQTGSFTITDQDGESLTVSFAPAVEEQVTVERTQEPASDPAAPTAAPQ